MDIKNILNKYIDLNYKEFHQKICKTKYEILGIKVPTLRSISKDLLKQYDYNSLLDNIDNSYYEYVMLKGFIIGNSKINYNEKIKLIDDFLKLVDNWAICDTFTSSLKFINKNKKEFLNEVNKYLDYKDEYHVRFGIVTLLDYYINDDYIDYVLNKLLNIKSDYYYVNMAISWCYSVSLVKYYNKTKEFLINNKNNIDVFILNKSISKACDSYRLTKEQKEKIKELK